MDLVPRFLDALERELSVLEPATPIDTLFIGGGTPTILDTKSMTRLFHLIGRRLALTPGSECSIEANPNHLDESMCQQLQDCGVNRISIGGQSFQPSKLLFLDRSHTPAELQAAIRTAEKFFDNISLDLIFGCPEETLSDWNRDLGQVIDSKLNHVSTYGLTYEKGAKNWGLLHRGAIQPLDSERELELYRSAIARLLSDGYEHYEVSNFARAGQRCQHNEAYWLNRRWLAFGPGAARFLGRVRSVNHRSTTRYIRLVEQGQCPVEERDELSDEQILRDRFVFGMRRLEGIDWNSQASDFQPSLRKEFESQIHQMCQWNLFEFADGRLKLTDKGLYVSDSIWPRFFW